MWAPVRLDWIVYALRQTRKVAHFRPEGHPLINSLRTRAMGKHPRESSYGEGVGDDSSISIGGTGGSVGIRSVSGNRANPGGANAGSNAR